MTTGHNGADDGSISIFQSENCRFAYTLNNTQPVRCSIIGDQPLFYMDFDTDEEDDFLIEDSDPFGIGAIEEGVAALKERIMSLDANGFTEQAEMRLADFIDESGRMTASTPARHGDQSFRLRTLEKTLRGSRLAASLLDAAKSHGITLSFSDQVEYAFYDRDDKTVAFNTGCGETDLVLMAIRELRRVWQHKNGALLHPLTFHPDQAILINRAQRADLSVAMIRTAWELQLSGIKEPWERLEQTAGDLARAFAREAFLDFRTINNGQAASAVFEAWFLSDRCRHEDRALIQSMLSDYQGYVFDNEQASKTVSADLLLALGSMPFGNNYLAPFVATVLSDPLFTEVRDRSNANFLWFIKFEQSFRAAEQELQTSSPIQDRDALRGSSITKKLDGDDEQHATVLVLPGRTHDHVSQKLPAAARADSVNAHDAGNVVYLSARRKQRG